MNEEKEAIEQLREVIKTEKITKLEKEIEDLKRDYEIITDDMKNHNVVYTDMPEFEEKYISKDKIRDKIIELTLKNKIPIKDQFVMYDVIKRNFQIEILEELLNEEGEPDAK